MQVEMTASSGFLAKKVSHASGGSCSLESIITGYSYLSSEKSIDMPRADEAKNHDETLQVDHITRVVERQEQKQVIFEVAGYQKIIPYMLSAIVSQPCGILRISE
jgi:hypothetical protein